MYIEDIEDFGIIWLTKEQAMDRIMRHKMTWVQRTHAAIVVEVWEENGKIYIEPEGNEKYPSEYTIEDFKGLNYDYCRTKYKIPFKED